MAAPVAAPVAAKVGVMGNIAINAYLVSIGYGSYVNRDEILESWFPSKGTAEFGPRALEIMASQNESWSAAFFDPNNADSVVSRAMMFRRLADAQGARIGDPCRKTINTKASRFGHTFKNHGQDSLNFIMNRFLNSPLSEQGQFLDDQVAAAFLLSNWPTSTKQPYTVGLPSDLPARVVLRDGSFVEATQVLIVPKGKGQGIVTAFPIR